MLLSMTGFGKATNIAGNKKVTIEIKSLNSKQLDVNIKVPSVYREKELIIRGLLSDKLIRGKIDFSLYYESKAEDKKVTINKTLALAYYKELYELSEHLQNTDNINYLSTILTMPEVMQSERDELDENEWKQVEQIIDEALTAISSFRKQEGESLEKDIIERVESIDRLRKGVELHLEERTNKVKERIEKNIQDALADEHIDQNRLEQEIIYYLEKLDITEENVRLENHCKYFLETLHHETSQGKKLGFISQEMGREINTLGSKANHVAIQQLVVQMKDELEKIKEQILNVV